jgi:hypothetical protein
MHRSGPDNRDLIGGAYNSYYHVAINPDYLGPARDLVLRAYNKKRHLHAKRNASFMND